MTDEEDDRRWGMAFGRPRLSRYERKIEDILHWMADHTHSVFLIFMLFIILFSWKMGWQT